MTDPQLARGIDVSHYENQIDWTRVRESGPGFAVIKVTEGNDSIDSRFDYNWTRARRVGMIRGAYHFFRPLVDPAAQAAHYLRMLGHILDKTDLPPVLDVEAYPDFIKNEFNRINVAERQRRVRVWLQTVEAATGRIPIIYTNYYSWRDYLGNSDAFARYPLWIAAYKVDRPKIPANEWGGKGWTFWQYTEKGVVPGIRDEAACVDMNYYRGDMDALQAWLKITGPRALPPSTTNGDMMAALIDAADSLGASSDEWVSRTGLHYLVDPISNSLRPYDGPAIEDLPLNNKEKKALKNALEEYNLNLAAMGITHQDMINAFFYAASLSHTGGWSLVIKAGLEYIGTDRKAIYRGPALADLPGLTEGQRDAISSFLGLDIAGEAASEAAPVPEGEVDAPAESSDPALPATYSDDLTNQAMINAFHVMALEMEKTGRELISEAGLDAIRTSRETVYSGPKIEDLPELTWSMKVQLSGLLNVPLVLPDSEIKVDGVDSPAPDNAPEEVPAEETPADAPGTSQNGVENAAEQQNTSQNEAEIAQGAPSDGSDAPPNQPDVQVPVVDLTNPVEAGTQNAAPTPPLTNQDVIQAFFRTAERLGREGWSLLQQAGLLDPTLERAGQFAGLAADKLDQIGQEVGGMVADILGMSGAKSLAKQAPGAGPYPGMVNLDMVNLFYKAAARSGENGQLWLDDSGLAYLNKSRASRFKPYHGPKIPELDKLTDTRRTALESALAETVLLR